MVLNRSQYDAAYFGDLDESGGLRHKAGYSRYLISQTDGFEREGLEAFLLRHDIPKDVKVLELGAGIGFLGKVATDQGYTNWTCVDWSNWCKRHEVYPVIEEEALIYLQAQPDNSFDYIISRSLIECIKPNELQDHAIESKRVGIKQIHTVSLEVNTKFYTLKTIPEWATQFLNDPDITIEDYFRDSDG